MLRIYFSKLPSPGSTYYIEEVDVQGIFFPIDDDNHDYDVDDS